jgi:hypothetical protein
MRAGRRGRSVLVEELQWLMMEGQARLASEQMGLWVDWLLKKKARFDGEPLAQPAILRSPRFRTAPLDRLKIYNNHILKDL